MIVYLCRLALISIWISSAAAGELDLSDMPRSICGWPSLHETGKFPEWNTRLAQYLLSYTLNEDIEADGIFTSETTEQIERFQSQEGLTVNGYLNIDTWPTLIDSVTPLNYGDSGKPVMALQDSLSANGFVVDITGVFDDITAQSLSQFQEQRGASEVSGKIVDYQSWHLLTTQCNISLPGHYWFDAGWPQGNVSVDTLKCLLDQGFEYGVFECWRESGDGTFWMECVDNVANAWSAGFKYVDVYMFPERYTDPVVQAQQLLANLSFYGVRYNAVMLDVEGDKWTEYSQEENQAFLLSLRSVFDGSGVPMTMYTGSTWGANFGENFTAFSDIPLTYAHYDNIPSFYDYDYSPFGGWTKASGKQFFDGVDGEVVCNLPLDWDWSPEPFWDH